MRHEFLIRLVLVLPLLIAGFAGKATAQDQSGYQAYASAIVANPPKDVVFREDFEDYLSGLASTYRRKNRRSALVTDATLREAARAQAVDMMLQGKSTHRSRAGHDFKTRFTAYLHADNTFWTGGENAASLRKHGAVDKARARELFQLWIDSSGHRKNLLNSRFVNVSTGVVQRGNELWSVQIFWSEPVTTNFTIQ